LQERINEDPSILRLGELTLIERERNQPSGGRIDFVLVDPEEGTRYEVEVMLGTLDESHIIRTIEYWDVERTRFPHLEHRAVIVAEEITNRFFNVISILNRAVPIIAIQMNAVRVDDRFLLAFTKILDIADLFANEEEGSGQPVDRSYWEKRSNSASLGVVDTLVSLLSTSGCSPRVTYNKYHIAVGTTGRNFLWCHPRKNAVHCHCELLMDGDERSEWVRRLDEVGIVAGPRGKQMKLPMTARELGEQKQLVSELLVASEKKSRGG
jgi:hypothetical protein